MKFEVTSVFRKSYNQIEKAKYLYTLHITIHGKKKDIPNKNHLHIGDATSNLIEIFFKRLKKRILSNIHQTKCTQVLNIL